MCGKSRELPPSRTKIYNLHVKHHELSFFYGLFATDLLQSIARIGSGAFVTRPYKAGCVILFLRSLTPEA
uniref:Uncharacterized protein n=1 Tax=Salix viminalis TaxID=40686 RepID=A0A6N2KMN2_SALVM